MPQLTSVKLCGFMCMELTNKKGKHTDEVSTAAKENIQIGSTSSKLDSCTQDCASSWFEETLYKQISFLKTNKNASVEDRPGYIAGNSFNA